MNDKWVRDPYLEGDGSIGVLEGVCPRPSALNPAGGDRVPAGFPRLAEQVPFWPRPSG